MERTALRGGLKWQTATVTSVTKETAAVALVGLSYPAERVKTERFGATGGH